MISLAWKVLLNSFFSQPWKSVAEGRYICTFPGLFGYSPIPPLLCPDPCTGYRQLWDLIPSTVRQQCFLWVEPHQCFPASKKKCFLRAGQELGTEDQPFREPPLCLAQSHLQKRHVCMANSDINHVVLLCKHSNVWNSVLFTISASKIIGEKRRKQEWIAALLRKRERLI